MSVQIVLLRGINVGSARRVPMADLRSLLEGLGYEGVRTYVQSGNIVLRSPAPAGVLARDLQVEISARFALEIPVIVRTGDELEDVVARDPLRAVAGDPKLYQVSFLSAEPDVAAVRLISALAAPSERVRFSGREIYAWHPDGVHGSKLARALCDARLGVTTTARNWRTVTHLLAMAGE